jgi:predicted RNA-binding protein associated with RNAse of E/G family
MKQNFRKLFAACLGEAILIAKPGLELLVLFFQEKRT